MGEERGGEGRPGEGRPGEGRWEMVSDSVRAGAGPAGLRSAPPEFVRPGVRRTPRQSPALVRRRPALPGSEQAAGLCGIEI